MIFIILSSNSNKRRTWVQKTTLRNLLFILILCSSASSTFSQLGTPDSALHKYRERYLYNAYSVAREVLRTETYLSESNTNTLRDGQQDSIRVLLSALIWYSNLQDNDVDRQLDSLGKVLGRSYKRLDSAYNKILPFIYDLAFFEAVDIADLRKYIDSDIIKANPSGYTKLKEKLKPYFETKGKKNIFEELLDTVNSVMITPDLNAGLKTRLEVAEKRLASHIDVSLMAEFKKKNEVISNSVDTFKAKKDLIEKHEIDSFTFQSDSIRLYDIAKNTWDAFKNELKDTIADFILDESRMKRELTADFRSTSSDSELKTLLMAISNKRAKTNKHSEFADIYSDKMIMVEQSNYVLAKESQTAAMELAMPSFKLPSEAEMIEAVAIYLAKRVKQESVMWFFETIQKNAKNYELLKTFFPETIILLQTNEVYDIPNLGAQWRYALSRDFVRMPRNVLTSEWFNKWYSIKINKDKNILNFLIATYDVCDLLNQQYSYNKLVEKMYLSLNKDAETEENKITPATIFSVLYAFNQECFLPTSNLGTDSMKTRLMKYQDFRNLTKGELEVMICLMDMKYGKAFTPIWKKDGIRIFLDGKNDTESFRRWAGTIEGGISQFNKLQGDYIKMTNEIREGRKIDAVYSIFNVWDNLNTLLNIVVDSSALDNDKLREAAKKSAAIKTYSTKAFEIYNQLSLKNYAGAIGSTISVVEELLYTKGLLELDTARIKDVVKIQKNREQFDELLDKYSNQKENVELKISNVSYKGYMYMVGAMKIFAEKRKIEKETSVVVNGTQYTGKAFLDTLVFYVVQKTYDYNKVVEYSPESDTTIGGVNFIKNQKLTKVALIDTLIAIAKEDSLFTVKGLQLKQNFIESAIVFEKDRRALKLVRNLAGFLNDVMLTTEPKQLAKVVESYALPPGSYKRKRNSWFSIDLNAYVGIYGGVENVKKYSHNDTKVAASVYGITAPIGLSFSKTFGQKLCKNDTLTDDLIRNPDKIRIGKKYVWVRRPMTWTLGISIVDLSAVISYQFSKNDSLSTGLPQEVKWEQLLSPGLKIGYGIPGTPLVATAGWQFTPKLRSFADDPSTQYNTHRFYLGILFDLPLVNVYQKSYRKSYFLKREK